MPGYDRTGPQGYGPRTGRGLGRCGPLAARETGIGGPFPENRVGWYGRGWGRGFGRGGWGRRGGFGRGIGWRAFDDGAGDELTPRQQQAFLRRRIGELKAELDRMSVLLSEDSRDETRDQE